MARNFSTRRLLAGLATALPRFAPSQTRVQARRCRVMKPQQFANRLGVFGVALALVAGCSASPGASPQPTVAVTPTPAPATGTPSPGPAISSSPTPGPTVTPVPSGWPYTGEMNDALFGEDGRVVLVGSSITVLDNSGSTVPGWPWTPANPGDAALRVAFGPDGSLYVAARVGSPGAWSWSLHHLGPDSKETAGFPVDLPAVSSCDVAVNEGDAFIYCQDEDEEAGVVTSEVTVVRPNGSTRDGWPVRMAGGVQAAGFGPDGRVYLHADFGDAQIKITALASDGTTIAGWPRTLTRGGVQIDAQGRVRVTSRSDITEQCGLPDETVYTMLRADGSTGPGWPVTAKGWSSDPELGDDGTMVIASATGQVTAYSSHGAVKDGWPVRRVSVAVGCWDGSRPWAAGDGTMVVVGDGSATLLTADGQVASGWPVTLPYEVASSCPVCAPGPGGPLAPAVGKRAVYIGAYQGEAHGTDGTNSRQPRVMVVERDGSMPPDAQRLIGTAGDTIWWVRIAPTGRVWALLISQDGSTGALHLVAEDAVPGS
jgi:hypothetical protein